jgi:hypothetical protein
MVNDKVSSYSTINYRCAGTIIALPLLFFFPDASASFAASAEAAAENRDWPNVSASVSTLVLTVAPSRLFLPSRLDCAIISVKSHNLPRGAILPVKGSRCGVHAGASFIWGGEFDNLSFATTIIPSSSKR